MRERRYPRPYYPQSAERDHARAWAFSVGLALVVGFMGGALIARWWLLL